MKTFLLAGLLLSGLGAQDGYAQAHQKQTLYSHCEVYQVTWYMIPEHPVAINHVLAGAHRVLTSVGAGHGYFLEDIKPGKRLNRLEKELAHLTPAVPIKTADVRLVGLFYADDHTDTLSIDNRELVRFHAKAFRLTRRLAKLLGAQKESLVAGERRQLEIIDARRSQGL